jgi:predicted NUDIX family NTP pyrophosphohydrolase
MKRSAGILLYRLVNNLPEVFLVHPGGPFFRNKDEGFWTVPKGEPVGEEELIETAFREFEEETGVLPKGKPTPLLPIVQKGGKEVNCWALEGDLDPSLLVSNTFELEWPPKSGNFSSFPEIDRGAWFSLTEARKKINQMQVSFLEELANMLSL